MSVRKNNFETKLVNILQRGMSKREAENALRTIRFDLYGDEYEEIHPEYVVDTNGHMKKEYPSMRELVSEYGGF